MARLCAFWLLVGLSVLPATAAEKPVRSEKVREIVVPYEDLQVLLEGSTRRVMLSRQEFDELRKKAEQTAESPSPQAVVLAAADYRVNLQQQRAHLSGTLAIEVLNKGLHAVPLDIDGVGLCSAILDGTPAAIGVDGSKLMLFVEGPGRHRLLLEMVAPLETTAARQVLQFRLPRPPAASLQLTAPGDVEVKSGAEVLRREIDQQSQSTRFDLLPPYGQVKLVLSLNSRLQRQDRAVVARGVQAVELTQAYERLHATVNLEILHQAVQTVRFVVPSDFEVTEVNSPMLVRWAVNHDGNRTLLEVQLREPTNETVSLGMVALRSPPRLEGWTMPRLEPLDVVGQMSLVGILLDERLRVDSIQPQGLVPINTADFIKVLPPSLLVDNVGAVKLIPVAAYYAPHGAYALAAGFRKPPAEITATYNLLLSVDEQGHQLHGAIMLRPEAEKTFAVDFQLPAQWQVLSVSDQGGKPLEFDRYTSPGKIRVHVRFPQGIPCTQETRFDFQAVHTPADWLDDWDSRQVEFPPFELLGATKKQAAIAVVARNDMYVHPEQLRQLTPLDQASKAQYGLAGVETSLAYRCAGPDYAATLAVDRIQPRLTARTYSFFRVQPDALDCHYELIYQVEKARTRKLALLLPATTPAALSIRGLDGATLKEYTSLPGPEGWRRWSVLLEEARTGQIRLAVDFQQALATARKDAAAQATRGDAATAEHSPGAGAVSVCKNLALPLVRADGVVHQSGLLAVEGSPDVDVQVKTLGTRRVDVGELAEAEYQPGNRLLGAFGFVADAAELKAESRISVVRHPAYAIQSAIVGQANLYTVVSAHGMSLTTATFRLQTKALLLEIQLPEGSELWSVLLDGQPLAPQRDGQRVLVNLPGAAGTGREMQVAYQTPVAVAAGGGAVAIDALALLVRAAPGIAPDRVPLADALWSVELPSGYTAIGSRGTMFTRDIRLPRPAILAVGEWLWSPVGGLMKSGMPFGCASAHLDRPATAPAVDWLESKAAPEQTITTPAEMSDDVKYEQPTSESSKKREDLETRSNLRSDTDKVVAKPAKETKPQAAPPQASAGPGKPMAAKQKRQMLGVRSLAIDTHQADRVRGSVLVFCSLGEQPRVQIELAPTAETDALALSLALTILLVGVTLTRRSPATKCRYLVVVAAVSMLVGPLSGSVRLAQIADMVFFAAAALVAYYLLALLGLWLRESLRTSDPVAASESTAPTTAVIALVLLAVWPVDAVQAETRGKARSEPYVIQVVEPAKPVHVPDDVLLRPYDSNGNIEPAPGDKLLIPYATYVELWNRAYPDKKLDQPKPPADYGVAGGTYRATLEGDEYLLLTGRLEVEVFGDNPVLVPFGLEGGVLSRATLDGQPAQIGASRLVKGGTVTPDPPKGPVMLVLQVSGKGRHILELEVRLHLERRGGWRVAEGVLPAAPATALALTVPAAQTEVRLGRIADRASFESEKPGETLQTALGPLGAIGLQWRPKIAEGQVDLSLTATSRSEFDVQEDGLRLVCHLDLEFRRSQRDAFQLEVPANYLVEKVEGPNVRGWEVRKDAKQQRVEVALLKTARDKESLVLHLSGRTAIRTKLELLDVPMVTAAGAALHRGQITIRRSPLLDLRTLESKGLERADLPARSREKIDPARSPLGLVNYQAWQFSTTPFVLRLAASPVTPKLDAQWQTLLRIADYERTVEARLIVTCSERPLHALDIFLPEDLDLRQVLAPGEFQWSTSRAEGRRVLSIYLATGQRGETEVVLRGGVGKPGRIEGLSLPRLELRDVQRQHAQIAVQVDPAFDVEAQSLAQIQPVLLRQLHGWLKPDQRPVTRLALESRKSDYSGKLRLRLRQPNVSCFTITNVRVTREAIEETILLNFDVRNAGVRQLSFLLPDTGESPRIEVPMLQEQKLQREGDGPDARLRVTLELQDERMGQVRVLVRNDRALTSANNLAPIPVVLTGRTDRQFVALESSGRDEVVVESSEGLEPISRQQKEWQTLKGLLAGNQSQAYMVDPRAEQRRLLFRTRDRAAVETAAARIGLAETTLVLDGNGTYRAAAVYRIDNSTEQFLEVDLPEGAALWTTMVAGEPVKPTRDPTGANAQRVQIPLVQTPAGQGDYPVVLKYAGHLPAPGWLGRLEFPLIRTVRIHVELSQLRLYLPESHEWFNFSDRMRMASSEEDLTAGHLAVDTKNAQRQLDKVRHGSDYEKARAAQTLKNLLRGSSVGGFSPLASVRERSRVVAQSQRVALEEVQRELTQMESPARAAPSEDNRRKLNDLYQNQTNDAAFNTVNLGGSNFYAGATVISRDEATTTGLATPGVFGADLGMQVREKREGAMPSDRPGAGEAGAKPLAEKAKTYAKSGAGQMESRLGKQAQSTVELQFAQQGQVIRDSSDVVAGQAPVQPPVSQQVAQPDRLGRYQQRLEEQSRNNYFGYAGGKVTTNAYDGATTVVGGELRGRPSSGPESAAFDPFSGRVAGDRRATVGSFGGRAAAAPQSAESMPAPIDQDAQRGLASLDFELPRRGKVFLFTAPRGEVEMAAWATSATLVERSGRLMVALVSLGLILLGFAAVRRGLLNWLLTMPGGWFLLMVGPFALCIGLQVLVAVGLMLSGLVILIARLMSGGRATPTVSAIKIGQ